MGVTFLASRKRKLPCKPAALGRVSATPRWLLVGATGLERGDLGADFLFGAPERLLQAADEFIILAFDEEKIVVREVGILLLEFAFDFVPGAFDFEFSHSA